MRPRRNNSLGIKKTYPNRVSPGAVSSQHYFGGVSKVTQYQPEDQYEILLTSR